MLLAGLGRSLFGPALHAYVGEQVPFERRGRAIGLVELAWAGSSLIGIPLVGAALARAGWRAPFLALGSLGVLSLAALSIALPGGGSRQANAPFSLGAAWRRLGASRAALGMLGVAGLTGAAADGLFVAYGAWLENAFDLSLAALGLATVAIGLAELAGEGLTVLLADRLGLGRTLVSGLALSTFGYALLPFVGQTLPLALAGLFVTFLAVEVTLVTTFSLCTEILPEARATMTASGQAALSAGRVAGALLGGPAWLAGGLWATGLGAAALSGLALLCLAWGLRHHDRF